MAPEADLPEYRARRDFAATPEPAPGEGPGPEDGPPRFVVQRHQARALHFDLRLEHEGALASWAVPKGPPLREGVKRLAVRTEDHPLKYLDFAAVIPEGQYGAAAAGRGVGAGAEIAVHARTQVRHVAAIVEVALNF